MGINFIAFYEWLYKPVKRIYLVSFKFDNFV